MEIPAETVDIMHTAVTTYHSVYFTMCAPHITFSAPLSCVILEFVCEHQPDNFLHFTLLIQFLGFVSCITVELETEIEELVRIRMDLILHTRKISIIINNSCHNNELNSICLLW